MQACCDAGDSCEIYQFSEHPSKLPNCWIGTARSFVDDPERVYISRSRTTQGHPWHLKIQQSRYVFASIDNFKISKNAQEILICETLPFSECLDFLCTQFRCC